jgi:hypothetical protein
MTILVTRIAAEIGTALRADMAVGQAFATDSVRSGPGHVWVGWICKVRIGPNRKFVFALGEKPGVENSSDPKN